MSRISPALAALVLAQAAHSVEEYVGRLWEVLLPARIVAGVFSSDLERGFIIGNALLVAFGVWCAIWPVRLGWRAAIPLAWAWVVVETLNGLAHPARSLWMGAYEPGLFTAPLLLLFALHLGHRLQRTTRGAS